MNILTSWDDGNRLDFKIIKLLQEYNLSGIFSIPNRSLYTNLSINEIKEIDKLGFIIAGHTKNHPQDIKLLDDISLKNEIYNNKLWIEMIIDKNIEWFVYPRGRFNEKAKEIVKKVGFKYARTTRIGVGKNDDYEIPALHCYQRKEYEKKDWLEYIKDVIWKYSKVDIVIHIFGHSWEIEKHNEWGKLEKLFQFINEIR